jgi:hypothetical protein
MTYDAVRNRNYINVVEHDPKVVAYEKLHTEFYTSKLAGGWRSDSILTRDHNQRRVFELYDLNQLPPVELSDLSAVKFDPMSAYLKASGLKEKLNAPGYQFLERFAQTYEKVPQHLRPEIVTSKSSDARE